MINVSLDEIEVFTSCILNNRSVVFFLVFLKIRIDVNEFVFNVMKSFFFNSKFYGRVGNLYYLSEFYNNLRFYYLFIWKF